MSAQIDSAIYAWCNDCADWSEAGITRDEAKAWVEQHDKDNHSDDDD